MNRILLIEDDALNRRVVRDMFGVAGIAIDEATDGTAGLAIFEQATFDLVLLDLRMPGMDGFEVMRRIRTGTDGKATTPIIVVSGETGPALRSRCIAAGANEVITKPIAMDALFKSVETAFAANSLPGHIVV